MERHIHRWAPCYGGYSCYCGKFQKSTPVNWKDVAARKRYSRLRRGEFTKKERCLGQRAITESIRNDPTLDSLTGDVADALNIGCDVAKKLVEQLT